MFGTIFDVYIKSYSVIFQDYTKSHHLPVAISMVLVISGLCESSSKGSASLSFVVLQRLNWLLIKNNPLTN